MNLPTKPLCPNDWVEWLPEHAVIADLAVDPYTFDATPPVVRSIEGIPLEPLMNILLTKGYDNLSLYGDYFERALYRATLKSWLHSAHSHLQMRR